jgi:hypothetical protein
VKRNIFSLLISKQFKQTVRVAFKVVDWIQGPLVYVIFEAYQFSKHEIEILLVAGLVSAMVFNTFIGTISDK